MPVPQWLRDSWKDCLYMRFWRILWLRQFFLIGVGAFAFGTLACVVQWAFNGHHKSGTLYWITGWIAVIGDMIMMLSVITFYLVDVVGDAIRLFRSFRKRP